MAGSTATGLVTWLQLRTLARHDRVRFRQLQMTFYPVGRVRRWTQSPKLMYRGDPENKLGVMLVSDLGDSHDCLS